jgi:hypothetical protein
MEFGDTSKHRALPEQLEGARLRLGWDEASQAIVRDADDGLVWPEFGNDGDDDLKG